MNHRVLVGPKAKVEFCNEKIKDKMGGDHWKFKVNE